CPLQILRDRLELAHDVARRLAPPVHGGIEAMIDVIVDQGLFCLADGLLDGVQLLRHVETGARLLDHRDDAPQMPFGPLQPLDDVGMAAMYHLPDPIPLHRIAASATPRPLLRSL